MNGSEKTIFTNVVENVLMHTPFRGFLQLDKQGYLALI